VFADLTFDDMLGKCTLRNWRVIADVTFTFNYWLSGPDVFGYHVVNLIIHICTAFLVYQLLFQILLFAEKSSISPGGDSSNDSCTNALPPLSDTLFWASFFAGLIFLLHPLATQAVTYITRRYNSLATLFYVASIVCYLKSRGIVSRGREQGDTFLSKSLFFDLRHLAWYGLSLVAAVFAMHSKEISITLPVMLVLLEFLVVQSNLEDVAGRILYLLPLLATGLIVPYHYYFVGQWGQPLQDELLPRAGFAEKEYLSRRTYFFSQLGIIWSIYLRLLALLWGQNVEHDFFVSDGLFHATTLAASLGLLSLMAIAGLTLRRYRLLALGILWFFVTISVTSSIIPSMIFVAEHRVYLPMIGLAFVTAGMFKYLRRPRLFLAMAIPLMLILSVLTFMRNNVWKSDLTLWGDALRKSPNMGRPYDNYALALHRVGRLDEAISYYEKVLTMPIVPYKSDLSHKLFALANLGTVYADKGMHKEALQAYQSSVRLTAPKHAGRTYFNMGNLFAELKQHDKAIESYKKALEISPGNYRAYTNLGWLLMSLGRNDEAEATFKRALNYNRYSAEAYLNLGTLYSKNPSRRAEAIAHYNRYLALKPNSPLRKTVLENIRKLEGEVRRQ
jgi:tetratricopeptide (TPR) repeat protein